MGTPRSAAPILEGTAAKTQARRSTSRFRGEFTSNYESSGRGTNVNRDRDEGESSVLDVSVSLTKASLDKIQLGETKADDLIQSGEMKLTGSRASFDEFFGLLDTYPFWFDIVTP